MTKVIVGTRETSRYPVFAGSTWVRLQYMLGLERLGLEVFWVDRLRPVDPYKDFHSVEYLVDRFERTAADFGFQDRFCIVYNGGERYFGLTEAELLDVVRSTDLLVNVSGTLPPGSPLESIPRRAYVNVDPGFTQIWAHSEDMHFEQHNFFFTTGQNVGRPEFQISTRGLDWIPILPPVVLEQWPANFDERARRFTTVADWRGSQEAEFEGVYYGTKRDEAMRLLDVPLDADQQIDIALCIGQHDYEDLGLLLKHGWRVRDPSWLAGEPHAYREFIRHSRAEFSMAKNGYVRTNSGWVSDRTACYLASGKPALVQSTGFEGRLPTGMGLLTYRTPEEAVAGIRSINEAYAEHCTAARRIAEEHFDSDVVLGSFLDHVGVT